MRELQRYTYHMFISGTNRLSRLRTFFTLTFGAKHHFLFLIMVQLLWLTFNFMTSWFMIGFWAKEKMLGKDLFFVAKSVECDSKNGLLASSVGKECEYYYGTFLLRISKLFGLNSSNYLIFYFVLVICFILALAVVLAHILQGTSIANYLLILPLVLAPPYLVLIQRGNLDILIFSMVALCSIFDRRNQFLRVFFFLGLTVLFKFYTLPLLFVYYFSKKKYLSNLGSILIFSTLVLISLEVLREYFAIDFQAIKKLSSSFGLQTFFLYLLKFRNHQFVFLLFLTTALVFLALYRSQIFSFFNITSKKLSNQFSNYSLILIFYTCYTFFVNFDWRLIFLAVGISDFVLKSFKVRYFLWFYSLILISLWFSTGLNFLAPIGDVALSVIFLFLSVFFIKNMKTTSNWN